MSRRSRGGPPPRIAELLHRSGLKPATPSAEEAAVAALQRERDRRAVTCFQELTALLARFNCTLQVVTQEIQTAGSSAVDRRCQINVVALDTPTSSPPAIAEGSSAPNGGAPPAA